MRTGYYMHFWMQNHEQHLFVLLFQLVHLLLQRQHLRTCGSNHVNDASGAKILGLLPLNHTQRLHLAFRIRFWTFSASSGPSDINVPLPMKPAIHHNVS